MILLRDFEETECPVDATVGERLVSDGTRGMDAVDPIEAGAGDRFAGVGATEAGVGDK